MLDATLARLRDLPAVFEPGRGTDAEGRESPDRRLARASLDRLDALAFCWQLVRDLDGGVRAGSPALADLVAERLTTLATVDLGGTVETLLRVVTPIARARGLRDRHLERLHQRYVPQPERRGRRPQQRSPRHTSPDHR